MKDTRSVKNKKILFDCPEGFQVVKFDFQKKGKGKIAKNMIGVHWKGYPEQCKNIIVPLNAKVLWIFIKHYFSVCLFKKK